MLAAGVRRGGFLALDVAGGELLGARGAPARTATRPPAAGGGGQRSSCIMPSKQRLSRQSGRAVALHSLPSPPLPSTPLARPPWSREARGAICGRRLRRESRNLLSARRRKLQGVGRTPCAVLCCAGLGCAVLPHVGQIPTYRTSYIHACAVWRRNDPGPDDNTEPRAREIARAQRAAQTKRGLVTLAPPGKQTCSLT